MCGIVGYVGSQQALPIVLNGIRLQEYRGYDSWGVGAVVGPGNIHIVKRVANEREFPWFEQHVQADSTLRNGTHNAIGHNRWATHGNPSDRNAHPHTDCTGKLAVVHNGTIENFVELKAFLVNRGHEIQSETDTELIAHLIEEGISAAGLDIRHSMRWALQQLQGAYALAVLYADHPTLQIGAKFGSPLTYAEVQPGNFVIASSPLPFAQFTRRGKELEDRQVVFIEVGKAEVQSFDGEVLDIPAVVFEGTEEELKLEGYPHFMLKEIHEQPKKLVETMAGRVHQGQPDVHLGGVVDVMAELEQAEEFLFVGSGTSYRAAMVGAWMFNDFLHVRARAIQASEVGSHDILAGADPQRTVAFAISQSGETRDLTVAITELQARGVLCLSIVNVVGSKIARMTKAGVYLRVGPEVGVASTKAFTATVAVEAMLTLLLARKCGMSRESAVRFVDELTSLPGALQSVLEQEQQIQTLAGRLALHQRVMVLGRGSHYATALEGALKMTEVAYVAAVAELAGEMKHGPIALIEKGFPVIIISPKDDLRDVVLHSIQEVKARGAWVIGICTDEDTDMHSLVDDVITIPNLRPALAVVPAVVAFQLLAYHLGVARGCRVDKPRNLAKSVTVQ